MTCLVDTNVISELCRRQPDLGVLAWASTVRRYAVSVISVDEVFFGLAWRPNARVMTWMEGYLERHEVLAVSPGSKGVGSEWRLVKLVSALKQSLTDRDVRRLRAADQF